MRARPELLPSEHSGSFSTPRRETQQAATPFSRVQAANDLAASPFGAVESASGMAEHPGGLHAPAQNEPSRLTYPPRKARL